MMTFGAWIAGWDYLPTIDDENCDYWKEKGKFR